jgi:hypothetical protein
VPGGRSIGRPSSLPRMFFAVGFWGHTGWVRRGPSRRRCGDDNGCGRSRRRPAIRSRCRYSRPLRATPRRSRDAKCRWRLASSSPQTTAPVGSPGDKLEAPGFLAPPQPTNSISRRSAWTSTPQLRAAAPAGTGVW